MGEVRPSLDEWRRLYEAANRLKELAPWEWLDEADIFGVQNPETGELGFVSIMGMLGEHYVLALYLGAEALSRFWDLEQSEGPSSSPETLLTIPALHVSFEDRNALTAEDRAVIKALGLKYRGRRAWPQFRSYRPGFFPWYLEPAEVRFLTCAVEQAIDVTPRVGDDRKLLELPGEDAYLVRVPHEEDGSLVWRDEAVSVPPTMRVPVDISMDMTALQKAKQLPRMAHALEAAFSILPVPIGERGARPTYSYLLLLVDAVVGLIYATEFAEAKASVEESLAQAPLLLVRQFVRLNMAPTEVHVASPFLAQFLLPLADELSFRVRVLDDLPALEEAMASLSQVFR